MPYIKKDNRGSYDILIKALADSVQRNDEDNHSYVGDLNYIISCLITKSMPGLRYKHINDIIGVLECVKQELYRRLAAPYEDKAIEKNGDIDVYMQ